MREKLTNVIRRPALHQDVPSRWNIESIGSNVKVRHDLSQTDGKKDAPERPEQRGFPG
jgi:hypothetical protein